MAKNFVAIIGMGCIFPKSGELKEYWHLIFNGIDAIEDIPDKTHWKIKDYFDPDPSAPDRTYCKRGGFIPPITFDPLSYGIPPNNIEATDTSQLLGLEAARMALEDAGYPEGHRFLKEKKINVILGVTGTQELAIPLGARLGHPVWKKALEDAGISEEKKNEVIQRIQNSYVQWQENSFPGLLGNMVAGRIANRLNFSGTNTVCDSACASSLSAIHTSIMELLSGECDMSITGGIDTLNDIFMHMCFSKTGILSPTGDVRPFSKDADGTLLGEGVGILVLKRLEDAERDNDRIYAIIRGIGTSSDGKTSAVYAPDSKGQLKALQRAYEKALIDPDTVELIEAHGTGTRVGDKIEFEALRNCFKNCEKNNTAIGSVKSMIGHTKAAAGAAGIIKTALSLYNKVIPPCLKAENPDTELDIRNSPFYLNSESKPWISKSPPPHPRRSGISSFGFGGSNFHAVLEEYTDSKDHVSWDGSVQIIGFSSYSKDDLLKQIERFEKLADPKGDADSLEKARTIAWQACESRKNFSKDDEFRLLIVLKKQDNLRKILKQAADFPNSGKSNIYFSSGREKGKLGFLFPGQGSQYTGMGKNLISIFPEGLEAVKLAQSSFQRVNKDRKLKLLEEYIFPPPEYFQSKKMSETELRNTEIAQPAIGAVSLAMLSILERFGVKPQVSCGHSFGELSALCSGGWLDKESFLRLAAARGRYMAEKIGRDRSGMLALMTDLKNIENLVRDERLDLVLANKNSNNQGVLAGRTDEIDRAVEICARKKIRTVKIPVPAAFHTRLFEKAVEPFKEYLSSVDLKNSDIEVLSNTTGKNYPKEKAEIKRILGNQLINPVNFVDNIQTMFENQVSTFVEVGPKAVLTGFVRSVLRGKDITAFSIDSSSGKKSGIEELAHALCKIASKGYFVDLTQWEQDEKKPENKKMRVLISGANKKSESKYSVPQQKSEISDDKKTINTLKKKHSGKNQPESKGYCMPSGNKSNKNDLPPENRAMKMIQKGFEAIQQLQIQTAKTHEKFLETQTQMSKTFADIINHIKTPVYNNVPKYEPAQKDGNTQMPEISSNKNLNFKNLLSPELQIQTIGPSSETRVKLGTRPEKGNSNTEFMLYETISKLTGFPAEMLEPDMDMESDLGIDSIKRVEIFSEIEKQIPSCKGLSTENIGAFKTLNDILNAITAETTGPGRETSQAEMPSVHENPEKKPDREIVKILNDIISELTGFPAEMLEPDMDMESDLGIDSIKRVEIFSRIEQEIDHIERISSNEMADLRTIREIASFLNASHPGSLDEPSLFKKKTENNKEPENRIERHVVSLTKYPLNQIRFYNGTRTELPDKKKVYITKDSSGIARAFKTEFEKKGIKACLIDITSEKISEFSDAAGIVIVPDSFKKKSTTRISSQFLKSAFLLARENARSLMKAAYEKGGFMAGISFLGGRFGFSGKSFDSDPVYGGLGGLVKTAGLEWKNVLCRALDMPDSPEKCIENAEAAVSLMMTQGPAEIGLDGDNCFIPQLVKKDVLQEGTLNLGRNDIVVITGGARGITSECAIRIAEKYSPVIILIGRSKEPCPEPEWIRGITDPAKMKKRILTREFKGQKPRPSDIEKIYREIISNREIKKNIEEIRNRGSKVKYFSADVRNTDEISHIFKILRKDFGKITAIIHGAGVLEDKLIVDKKMDQFSRVFDTKVKGLDSLILSSKKDRLKYFILFSSIAARIGSKGQCDYSAANEAINKTAGSISKERPDCKVLSVNWGPWEGGMVNGSLKKDFSKKRIPLIPLKSGAKQLLKEMENPEKRPVEIIIKACAPKKDKPPVFKAFEQSLGVESCPVLESHKIDGKPVVPFALLMELQACAAEKSNPGLILADMNDIRLLKGIKPYSRDTRIDINLEKCRPYETGYQALSNISSNETGKDFIHSSSQNILKDYLPEPPVLSKALLRNLKPFPLSVDQAYASVLFHGKSLQGIRSIKGYSNNGIEVITDLAPSPDQWFKKPFNKKWVIDPMMLDSAFQAAILWTYKKSRQVCLPSFIANLKLYSSFKHLKDSVRILFTVNEETEHKIQGYFTFLNSEDVIVASITGFEAVKDTLLIGKFKNRPLFLRQTILEFAQGSPSKAFGDRYKKFDERQKIARLPRPPYFFMDRVLKIEHPQWKMEPGGWIETECDIPEEGWYFKSNGTDTLPFCVFLEIALQPCGWLSAYAGSALHSRERLYFRNLGGKADFIRSISKKSRTVTVRTRMKEVSKAGGMIIQDFDIQILKNRKFYYKGKTNFGFFTKKTLFNQIGIRNGKFNDYSVPEKRLKESLKHEFRNHAPLTPYDSESDRNTLMPSKALRMIDRIEILSFDSGLYKKGYIKAVKEIDPDEWFFNAHFYQDPVCPGSLGIESFLQMLRFFLIKRFDIRSGDINGIEMKPNHAHEWIYRGQVTPENKDISVHAHVKTVSETSRSYSLCADGSLNVDSKCIYEMKNFSLQIKKAL